MTLQDDGQDDGYIYGQVEEYDREREFELLNGYSLLTIITKGD